MSSKMVSKILKQVTRVGKQISKVLVKSLGSTSVQLVLGSLLVLYISFLESEKESVLTLAMLHPVGRFIIMSILALLAVTSPPVAILFAVLIVMSYSRSDLETVVYQPEREGFWAKSDTEPEANEDADMTEDSETLIHKFSDWMRNLTKTQESFRAVSFENLAGYLPETL